jgi:anti-sigma factor RsiW
MTERLDETDLHAFVDNRLSDEDRLRVGRRIASDPGTAARVAAWSADAERLRAALAFKAEEPLPRALDMRFLRERSSMSRETPFRWMAIPNLAALALALMVGAGAGWLLRGSDASHGLASLEQQAALAQRVFTALPRTDFGAEANVQRVGWGGPRAAREIVAPDLSRDGYALLGGQYVPTDQGAAVMFLYANAAGERMSLFVRLMIGIDENAPLRPVSAAGVSGFAWSRAGVGFTLVSDKAGPASRPLPEGLNAPG